MVGELVCLLPPAAPISIAAHALHVGSSIAQAHSSSRDSNAESRVRFRLQQVGQGRSREALRARGVYLIPQEDLKRHLPAQARRRCGWKGKPRGRMSCPCRGSIISFCMPDGSSPRLYGLTHQARYSFVRQISRNTWPPINFAKLNPLHSLSTMAFGLDLPMNSDPRQASLLNSMHGPARTPRDVAALSAHFGGQFVAQVSVDYSTELGRSPQTPRTPVRPLREGKC